VLLKDGNMPSLKWQLARMEEVIPGADGIIRVAIIRTATGLIKQAAAKIAVLSDLTGNMPFPMGQDFRSRSTYSLHLCKPNWH